MDSELQSTAPSCKNGTCSHPKAARSVHLWWSLPNDVATVTNEVCVQRSSPGSYFCIIGFSGGYSGIQENIHGSRFLIFSVWDNRENKDPPEEKRVRVLQAGNGVEVSRFGNEGTGGKTKMPYNWKDTEPVKFQIRAESDETREWTKYSCFVYDYRKKSWFHMATMKTIARGKLIRGVYSFVEDFRRDKKSFHESRRALYGDCLAVDMEGRQITCKNARFTGDKTPADNINAGCCNGKFFLETGGETRNTHTKLNCYICK